MKKNTPTILVEDKESKSSALAGEINRLSGFGRLLKHNPNLFTLSFLVQFILLTFPILGAKLNHETLSPEYMSFSGGIFLFGLANLAALVFCWLVIHSFWSFLHQPTALNWCLALPLARWQIFVHRLAASLIYCILPTILANLASFVMTKLLLGFASSQEGWKSDLLSWSTSLAHFIALLLVCYAFILCYYLLNKRSGHALVSVAIVTVLAPVAILVSLFLIRAHLPGYPVDDEFSFLFMNDQPLSALMCLASPIAFWFSNNFIGLFLVGYSEPDQLGFPWRIVLLTLTFYLVFSLFLFQRKKADQTTRSWHDSPAFKPVSFLTSFCCAIGLGYLAMNLRHINFAHTPEPATELVAPPCDMPFTSFPFYLGLIFGLFLLTLVFNILGNNWQLRPKSLAAHFISSGLIIATLLVYLSSGAGNYIYKIPNPQEVSQLEIKAADNILGQRKSVVLTDPAEVLSLISLVADDMPQPEIMPRWFDINTRENFYKYKETQSNTKESTHQGLTRINYRARIGDTIDFSREALISLNYRSKELQNLIQNQEFALLLATEWDSNHDFKLKLTKVNGEELTAREWSKLKNKHANLAHYFQNSEKNEYGPTDQYLFQYIYRNLVEDRSEKEANYRVKLVASEGTENLYEIHLDLAQTDLDKLADCLPDYIE